MSQLPRPPIARFRKKIAQERSAIMANNLFISYDLYKPDRDYADLFKAIKSLGAEWVHLKLTLWFVVTPLSAAAVRARLWTVMQPQDKLIVIDASNNCGSWIGIDAEQSNYLKVHWR